MKVDGNIFHAWVEHWVDAYVSGTDIIIEYYKIGLANNAKFVWHISNPIEPYNDGSDGLVFNFSGRSYDCVLFFETSTYHICPKEDNTSWCKYFIINVACPISDEDMTIK